MKLKSNVAWQILEQLNNNLLLSDIEQELYKNGNRIKEMGMPFYQAIYQLVDNGCLEYTKLSSENYNYWWYEMPKGQERQAKKTIFTCNVDDFKITKKGIDLLELRNLDYFKENKHWHFFNFLNQYHEIQSNLKLMYYKNYDLYKSSLKDEAMSRIDDFIKDVKKIYEYKKDKKGLFV